MKERLIYIVQHASQLSNVIFAINEWSANVASWSELEHCLLGIAGQGSRLKGNEPGPLRSLISRVLLFQPQENDRQDPSSLAAGCANLIATVMLSLAHHSNAKCSPNLDGAAHSLRLRRVLAELLKRGRSLAFQVSQDGLCTTVPSPKEIAGNITNCIFDLLHRALKDELAKEFSSSHGADILATSSQNSMILHLEDQLSNVLNLKQSCFLSQHMMENPRPISLIDLLTKRDQLKMLAAHSGLTLDSSLKCEKRFDKKQYQRGTSVNCAKNDWEHDEDQNFRQLPSSCHTHHQNVGVKHDLILKIMGVSFCDSIASFLKEACSLEEQKVELFSRISREHEVISCRKRSILSKRKDILHKIDCLHRELRELEFQDQQLAQDELHAQSEAEQLDTTSEKQLKTLENNMRSVARHVAMDRDVRLTAEKVGELECYWTGSVFTPTSAVAALKVSSLQVLGTSLSKSSNLDQYLQYAECYFQTEAQCIEFLNNRATSEVDAFDDKGGHQQLRLGHDHMTLKLRASEDNAVVDILKKEANEMWLDFTHRVGDYCGSAGKGKHSPDVENIVTETLNSSQLMIQEGISKLIADIESKCHPDADIVTTPKPTGPTLHYHFSHPPTGATSESSVMSPRQVFPIKVPTTSAVMPKLSWAINLSDFVREGTISILDIQREEMMRQGSNN